MSKTVEEAFEEWLQTIQKPIRAEGAMSIGFQAGFTAGVAHGEARERLAWREMISELENDLGIDWLTKKIEARIRQRGEK